MRDYKFRRSDLDFSGARRRRRRLAGPLALLVLLVGSGYAIFAYLGPPSAGEVEGTAPQTGKKEDIIPLRLPANPHPTPAQSRHDLKNAEPAQTTSLMHPGNVEGHA